MDSAALIGKTIDKYRILSVLGEGGMGAVFLAEHQTIGRRVAVKVLRPELAVQADVVERFLNEARATNRIRHPSIVDIYDCDRQEGVGAYLVMELLEGTSLDKHCKPGSLLPLAEVVQLVAQVAAALAAAHRCQIVHRDLKPANIFLVADPERPGKRRAKVLDFGIAKLLAGGSGVHTRTGSLIGTPAYMSPEQCHGAQSVDHRTDIYALGVITYELLAGRPPFVADGYGALIAMQLSQPPPPLRQLSQSVPEDVESVVLQCLAKSPGERFDSMDAFSAALQAAAGTPAVTVPPTRIAPGADALAPTLPPAAAPPHSAPSGPSDLHPPTTSPGPGQAPVTAATSRRTPVLAAGIVAGVLVALGAGYGVMRYFSAPPAPGSIDAAARVAAPDLGARLASAGTQTPDATALGQEPAEVAGSGGSSSTGKGPCQPGEWGGPPAPPLPLRKLKTRRSKKLIVGFSLDDVVQGPALVGQGVRGRQNALGWALRGCSDSPDRRFARQGTAYTDQRTGLRFEITGVKPAGRTGRSWPGVSCSYRISDPQDPRLYVDLDAKLLPAFNELTVALRDGPMVYVALQFNGYAREVGGQGNRVLGLDLCEHRLVWSSPDMVSNSPVLLRGPHLITAYGFTAEPDFLYVLDRRSGKVVNRARLPKGADELRLVGDRLYVRIYDGYIVFGLGGA